MKPSGSLAAEAQCGPSTAHATVMFHLGRDLEEEHQALLEDQKIYRSRARKYFIETNRRRRALEEKWKQKEEKEKRFRERVLQQRKLKHQEATEKFQRTHLPFPQHEKIVKRKPVPQLEEALEQIKGSVLTSGFYLPNREKTNCRTTDSPSVSSRNDYLHQKQTSAWVSSDKAKQENSTTNPDSNQLFFQQNLEEMQQFLEEQHLSNLENFHQEVNQITNSESLSSLDSLEAGEQNESNMTPSELSSLTKQYDSTPYNSQKSEPTNKSFPETAELTLSKNQHVNNWLRKLDMQSGHIYTSFHDDLPKHNVLIPTEHGHNPKQKSSVPIKSEQRMTEICASDKQVTSVKNLCTFRENKEKEKNSSSFGMVSRESLVTTDNHVFKPSKAWATSDSSQKERIQDLVQGQSSEIIQPKTTTLVQMASHPMATPVILPPKQWNSIGSHNSSFSADIIQKEKNTNTCPCTDNLDNLIEEKEETTKYFNDNNQGSSLFQDASNTSILCNIDQEDDKEEHGNTAKAMPHLSDAGFNSDLPNQHKNLRKNVREGYGVKLLKSILKKESKYENNFFKSVVMKPKFSFGNQTISCIRDSLELVKIKEKNAEDQKTNKKLRWFDENHKIVVEGDEKCSERNPSKVSQAQLQPSHVQTKINALNTDLSIASCTASPVCSENHQDSTLIYTKSATAGGSERDCTLLNSLGYTRYHFAKQAWMASPGEKSNPLYSNDSKIQRGNLHKGKTKIIRRPISARAQTSFIPKNRKGTIIRAQSASEASKVIRAQGKIMIPHPPPKLLLDCTTGQNVAETRSGYQPVNSSKPQTISKNNDLNAKHILPADQNCNKSITENNKSTACGHMTISTLSTSVSTYEPLAKTIYTVDSIQTSAQQDCCIPCTKKRPVYAENGPRLDRTPTDEEINLLCEGVHSALAQKEFAAGDFRHYGARYNNSFSFNLQPTNSGISLFTIDGGSLMTNLKSVSRMNGFLSSINGAVPTTRRKQNFDNAENKRRGLLEQRRQAIATTIWRSTHPTQNSVHTVQLSPFQYPFEPVQAVSGIPNSDEVSESTAQFLLAEKLASISVTEGEMLSALETTQPCRQPLLLNKPQRLGMTALSMEEHKILQSLDHLNQRLQNIRESITKNPSTSRGFQIISPLHGASSPSVDTTLSTQRHQSMSADPRLLLQRRY
ncbi:centrosomal protein of 126 kDa isoform X2 [Alligator sinensis]|uniref:Centrosomal protein of 126 kDa isoform X2 n=1 Tax=Alligator sinensis TaxID=38654 RepID=A0A1U8DRD8_ALLSI|nr:centrosomal protein of 126 kDa isoform X2 [Alligator sinensis]